MTKLELIFSVKYEIERQNPTQDGLKFSHPKMVEAEISKAYDTIVQQFFSTPEVFSNYDLDYYSKSYDQTMKTDSAGTLYVDLPAKPLPLMYGLGVRLVKPKDSNVQINRITEAEFMALRELEAFCCSPVPFCYVDNSAGKIVLQANRDEYNIMTAITVKLIPKFSEFAGTDEINSPLGDVALSQMVLQLTGIKPTDNSNDDGK